MCVCVSDSVCVFMCVCVCVCVRVSVCVSTSACRDIDRNRMSARVNQSYCPTNYNICCSDILHNNPPSNETADLGGLTKMLCYLTPDGSSRCTCLGKFLARYERELARWGIITHLIKHTRGQRRGFRYRAVRTVVAHRRH